MKTIRLIILGSLCSFAVLAQNRYYVNQTKGDDTFDGSSWSNAFATLQMAIDEANTGDEIWVASGIYLPSKSQETDSEDPPTNPRNNTFSIPNGVQLYGGFPAQADNSTGMNNRDWERHTTILSGDLNNDDGADFTRMADNVYHVVTLLSVDESTIIDGFTITGGNADKQVWFRQPLGGGINAVNNSATFAKSSPTLRNLIIEGNASNGGGAGFGNYTSYGDACPVISNTIIRRNKSGEYGGGFANEGRLKSSPIIENVTIIENQAFRGGGMYCVSQDIETAPVLTNVGISGNSCENSGGGCYLDSYGGDVKPILTNVSVSGNSAGINAGGMFFNAETGKVEPVLTNVTIAGNKAGGTVGGLVCRSTQNISSPEIRNTVIWGNKANVMQYNDFYNEGVTGSHSDFQSCLIGDLSVIPAHISPDTYARFVMPVDANFAPTTAGDYRPDNGSPLINKGNNLFVTTTVDLAGKPRIFDNTVDIGAYEYQDISTFNMLMPSVEKIIWSEAGNLYVRIDQPALVRIYSVDGRLVQQLSMSEGVKTIPLPSGFYLVSLNNETTEKVFVSK